MGFSSCKGASALTSPRTILSVNQLSVYGAVAATCDEYENHQDRTGEPVILMGQSIVLGEVKAEVPVHDEDPRNDQIIWQQYIQQVESARWLCGCLVPFLSQRMSVSRIVCCEQTERRD